MFDINEYYCTTLSRDSSISSVAAADHAAIEDEISADIETILTGRFENLYRTDRFKSHDHTIDIVYPRISYPDRKTYIKGADHIRFLLSLYPRKSDLDHVEKLIVRPRHIQQGAIELMALYIRNSRTLVQYICTPHFYSRDTAQMQGGTDFIPYQLNELVKSAMLCKNGNHKTLQKVPPLWYMLSIISPLPGPEIDKFFVRTHPDENREMSTILDEISFYYSRYGY